MDSCPRETSGKSGQSRWVLTCRRDVHFPPLARENPCHACPLPLSNRGGAERSRGQRAPPSAAGAASPSARTCPSPPPCRAWEGARERGMRVPSAPRPWVCAPRSPHHPRGSGSGSGAPVAGNGRPQPMETPAGEGGEGGDGPQGRRTMMSGGRYRDGE